MRVACRFALAAALLCGAGGAHAQQGLVPLGETGPASSILGMPYGAAQLNGLGGLLATATLSATDANPYFAHSLVTNFDPAGTWSSIDVGLNSILNVTGSASSAANGAHAIALNGWLKHYSTGTTLFGIATEGKIDILAGTLATPVGLESNFNTLAVGASTGAPILVHPHLASANGAITGGFYGVRFDVDDLATTAPLPFLDAYDLPSPGALHQTISTYRGFHMEAIKPALSMWVGARVFAQNDEPTAAFTTAGPIYGARGQEIGAVAIGHVASRYYFGVAPGPTLTTLPLVAGYGFLVPFRVQERTVFSKLGFEIATAAAAGKNIQAAIYKAVGGVATGAPVYTGQNHSAASAGVVGETGLAITLEAGTYFLVLASDGAPVMRAYSDPAAAALTGFGASNTSADSTEFLAATPNAATPAATWAANPAVGYIAEAAVFPQIWLRK